MIKDLTIAIYIFCALWLLMVFWVHFFFPMDMVELGIWVGIPAIFMTPEFLQRIWGKKE